MFVSVKKIKRETEILYIRNFMNSNTPKFKKNTETRLQTQVFLQASFLTQLSLDCWVCDLAHEEDALGAVLQDQNQKRPVEVDDIGEGHGHDLDGGDRSGFSAPLINTQDCFVSHLRGKKNVFLIIEISKKNLQCI